MNLQETNRTIPKEGLKWTDLQIGDTIYIPKTVNDFVTTYLVEITSIEGKQVNGVVLDDYPNHNGSAYGRHGNDYVEEFISGTMKKVYLIGNFPIGSPNKDKALYFDALGNLDYDSQDDVETILQHESFGQINISHFQTNTNNQLYGSSIEHRNGISITISESEVKRDLSHDWYHSGKTILEVEMSPSQFAEAITTAMNSSGVPCTIRYREGKTVDRYEFTGKRAQFNQEFTRTMRQMAKDLDKLTEDSQEILNRPKTPTKSERTLINNEIESLKNRIANTLPFLEKSFEEQLDQSVLEAKMEIESFHESKIRSLGLGALQSLSTTPIMIEEE